MSVVEFCLDPSTDSPGGCDKDFLLRGEGTGSVLGWDRPTFIPSGEGGCCCERAIGDGDCCCERAIGDGGCCCERAIGEGGCCCECAVGEWVIGEGWMGQLSSGGS